MRKVSMSMLIAALVTIGFAAQGTMAKEKKAKMASDQQARWHGIIVRSDKDGSTLTVRRQGVEKTIHYDSSTKWTNHTKAIDMAQVKDGADVICLGKYDEKGEFHADRIDLRRE